jgi:amino acid adenylation domain-containing protein
MNSSPKLTPLKRNEHFIPFDRAELETTLVDRFEKQARLYPENTAVKQGGNAYSYHEINQHANQVANILSNKLGSYRGPVAFLVDHGFPQIITIFGILKSGNAYLALDPDFPQSRLEYMLFDSETPLLVTNTNNIQLAKALSKPGIQIINLDEIDPHTPDDNPGLDIPLDAIALIQYTSGSTGQPKGCILTHKSLMHMAMVGTNMKSISSKDRFIFLVSGSYAAHVGPVFQTLLNGACVYPYEIKQQGLTALADFLVDEKITIISTIPSTFRYFASSLGAGSSFPDVRLLNMGGDTCLKVDVELFKKFFPPSCTMINPLGGTEFMGATTFMIHTDTQIKGGVVPVGYPNEDKKVLLVDDEGIEVPPGEVGEIVVQSKYLSPGYWRRPELTEEVFQPVPDQDGVFQYHTGDLGRRDPDDCLYHLGRKDSQVKVRGHRVELDEVTSKLFESPAIKDAFVNAHTDQGGENRLVAYLVPIEKSPALVEDILAELKESLPSYMIPTDFLVLDEIPKLPSGKVDARTLPEPQRTRSSLRSKYVPPQNTVERKLVEIWEDLLEFQPVGIEDDFFELGGHSLLALRLIADIDDNFEISVPLPALAQVRTIKQLAVTLQDKATLASWSSLVALQPLGEKPPFFCVPPSGVTAMIFKDLARHMGAERPFYVLEYAGMDEGTEPHETIPAIARHNLEKIRRLQPQGPYYLGGMCFGGSVAYEMAHQLKASNQEVAFLGVLDSSFPPRQKNSWRSNTLLFLSFINEKLLNGKLPIGPRAARTRVHIANVDPQVENRIQKLFSTHGAAQMRYKSPPYPGKITLFNTRRRNGPRIRAEWQAASTQSLDFFEIPGHHGRQYQDGVVVRSPFILEPHVQDLAKLFNERIDQATNQSGS